MAQGRQRPTPGVAEDGQCKGAQARPQLPPAVFFQAEDGIRCRNVTGVQTCALPISNLIEQDREMKVSASRTKRAKQHRVSRRQVNQQRPPTVASHEAGNGAQHQSGQLEKIILKLVRGEPVSLPPASGNGNGNGEAWPSGRNGHTEKEPKSAIRSGVRLEGSASSGLPLWKRFLDVSLIVLTLICWFPLMVLLMVWIRMVSPGPIFYRQERIGYRGGRFMIF